MIVKVAFVIGEGSPTILMNHEAFWYKTKDIMCTIRGDDRKWDMDGWFELDTT